MKTAWVLLLTALTASAGSLRVLVRDPSGASVSNALVQAGEVSGRTDSAGEAMFTGLPPGSMQVTISADGFTSDSTRVKIGTGTVTLERMLRLAPRSDEIEVGVDPRESATDPRGGLQSALTPEQIEQLPDDPEEMEEMLKQMAGPGSVIRVNGFTGGRLPHKSQIQSIRFRLTPYSAEEHDDGFMVVDVITKAGLGAWHGDANFAFGDDALNARNAFARFREPQQSRKLDVNLMGPFVRNRTSTNFHFNRNDGYDSRVSTGLLPTGPFSELIPLPNSATNATGRLQHSLTRSHLLTGEYSFQQANRTAASQFDLRDRASTTHTDTHQLRLANLGSFGERLLSESRFQTQWTSAGAGSLTQSPAVIVQGAFHAGGANVDSSRQTTSFELTQHLTYTKGKHSLRWGFQLDHLRHQGRDFTNGFGTTVYPSLAAYVANQPIQTSRRSTEVTVGYQQSRGGVYVQDDIRLLKNLSVSLGLRQEAMTQIAGVWNPAPRAGFAWAPFRSGKTTFRGGMGVFNRWYEASVYEETLRLNGAAQVDLISSSAGTRLPGFLQSVESLRMPYVIRTSIGIQQQLPLKFNLTLDYRRERGLQMLRSRNVNTPHSGLGYLLQLENGARTQQDGLFVGLHMMPGPDATGLRSRLFWHANYFLSRARDEVSSALTPPVDSTNARADWGASAFDTRHRFSTMTQLTWGKGLQSGVFLNVTSAAPYNITTGFDNNGDSFFNDRPAGTTRNSARGSGQVNLSTRMSWSFGVGKRGNGGAGGPQMVRVVADGSSMPDFGFGRSSIRRDAAVRMQLYATATNVLNRLNPAGFAGVITSPFFGQPLMAMPPRRLEVGIRVGF